MAKVKAKKIAKRVERAIKRASIEENSSYWNRRFLADRLVGSYVEHHGLGSIARVWDLVDALHGVGLHLEALAGITDKHRREGLCDDERAQTPEQMKFYAADRSLLEIVRGIIAAGEGLGSPEAFAQDAWGAAMSFAEQAMLRWPGHPPELTMPAGLRRRQNKKRRESKRREAMRKLREQRKAAGIARPGKRKSSMADVPTIDDHVKAKKKTKRKKKAASAPEVMS